MQPTESDIDKAILSTNHAQTLKAEVVSILRIHASNPSYKPSFSRREWAQSVVNVLLQLGTHKVRLGEKLPTGEFVIYLSTIQQEESAA